MLEYVYGDTPGTALTWNAASCGRSDLGRLTTTTGPGLTHQLSSTQDFEIKVAAPVGYLFGRLLFGWLADIVGRKRMCM
jgi:MFS family permease